MSHGTTATIKRISGSVHLLRKSTVAASDTGSDLAEKK
jgi:hypothetical protein